jgi:hypothetical protein
LSLTSKAPKEPSDQYLPVRDLVEHGEVSFIELKPLCYPAKSVCHGKNQRVRRAENHLFSTIVKEIGLKGLGLDLAHYRA